MVVLVNGESNAVYGHTLSTVVPASVTGETVAHELTNMDLAMKLHYLRGVYYFRQSEIINGLAILTIKEPMFPWLDVYFAVSGRIWRSSETERPFVKCNDCGVRIIEAKCSKTIEEWLEASELSQWRYLVSDKVLGPDLHFSPMVYIQFTRFKCGGMAIGFSWAHVLGDAASATNCINLWGKLLGGSPPPKSYTLHNTQKKSEKAARDSLASTKPLSAKLVDSVGDSWLSPNNCKMETYSFQITDAMLKYLMQSSQATPFEMISALVWQNLAKVREGKELKTVTICRSDLPLRGIGNLSNEQKISSIALDYSADDVELSELAMLIAKEGTDETKMVEGLVDKDTGKPDVVVYGANLTFVDMQGIDLYGLELKGEKPVHVEYSMDGVGREGAVLVHQGGDGKGRILMVILPEDEITQLREMLQSAFGIA
ncbi:protein ECERIFERUM 26-like [Typha latifolia]|uniref:protein ECERIFERUM 26-like n=1 Tax=Typha latifolia TaxID=4733 RepID=UPI003C2E1833